MPKTYVISERNRVPVLNAILLFVGFLCGIIAYLPLIRSGMVDFRNMYAAGYMVRSGYGHEIYDPSAQKRFQNELVSFKDAPLPFIRPAYQALLFAPFSFLPFRLAYCAFYAFNLAVLTLCFRLLQPYMAHLTRVASYLPAVMFLFVPINLALAEGQDSIILLTLVAGALACIEQDREYLAGVLVALGSFKFQLVIPIAVLFLLWRRWRFSVAFSCTAAVLTGVSIWIVGVAQSVHYCQSIAQLGYTGSVSPRFPLPVERMANLHGALSGILGRSSLVLPLTIVASAGTIIFFASRRPLGSNALLIAIPASALVSYYLFPYDTCILMIPIAVIFSRLMVYKRTTPGRLQLVTAALLFASPCVLMANLEFWTVSIPLIAFALVQRFLNNRCAPEPTEYLQYNCARD